MQWFKFLSVHPGSGHALGIFQPEPKSKEMGIRFFAHTDCDIRERDQGYCNGDYLKLL